MITRLDSKRIDADDREIIHDGLRQELQACLHLLRFANPDTQEHYRKRANRILGLMTQLDGRMRPIL